MWLIRNKQTRLDKIWNQHRNLWGQSPESSRGSSECRRFLLECHPSTSTHPRSGCSTVLNHHQSMQPSSTIHAYKCYWEMKLETLKLLLCVLRAWVWYLIYCTGGPCSSSQSICIGRPWFSSFLPPQLCRAPVNQGWISSVAIYSPMKAGQPHEDWPHSVNSETE